MVLRSSSRTSSNPFPQRLVLLSAWVLVLQILVESHWWSDGTTTNPTTGGTVFTHAAYIVTIPPRDEACFYVHSTLNSGTLYGNFEVVDEDSPGGGSNNNNKKNNKDDDISLIILDFQNQRTLFRSRRGHANGSFTVSLQAKQKVQLCLQNGIWSAGRGRHVPRKPSQQGDTGRSYSVGLTYTFEETDPAVELQVTNTKLLTSTKSVHRELRRLLDHYNFMRAREASHRETVERTFSRLMAWVLLQGFVVIVVAGAQVMYFRRFLERRRYI